MRTKTKTAVRPTASLLTFRMADVPPVPHATATVGHATAHGHAVIKTFTSGTRTVTLVPADLLLDFTAGYAVSSASVGMVVSGRAA